MKILFIQAMSTETSTSEMVYPIGIVTLATLIKKDYTVEIFDMNIQEDPFSQLKKKLESYQPEIICISLRNIDPLGNKMTSLIPPFVATIKMIAVLVPKGKIIVGGTGFSLFPKRIMEELPEIQYGIIGEGENTLPKLLANLENPSHLKGLCFREKGEVVILSPSKELDMDCDYIQPDRNLLSPTLYNHRNSYVQTMGVETKRGCPFNCSYCVYPNLQGKKLRCRSPKKVVDEIELLNKEFGIERIHFTDPVVNIPRGHLESICELLIERNIKVQWSGFFREDYLDEDNMMLFKNSGCECFSFSPDGLSQEALDVLGKGFKVEDIIRAAKLSAKTGVLSVYHFMVNVPGDNEDTIKKGMELIDEIYTIHRETKSLGTIVLNNVRIYPNTPIFEIARKKGFISSSTDLLYPVYYNPEPLSSMRYQLETFHLCKNIFMWQELK
ncbi:putative variant cofactor biosynthesis B12-binding domain/radical SAM domain protein 1 [Anaerovirgula multivorans]|uniref:Putative variant cofactor biosynthesis B12-binding domain/radical SAM domain protein 1 n=1 Tax=Anaerovirgula multivorans TaxID=312168 RepID=A0A238ZVQ1_9FIRM|nr:B12 lower ligand biosynthesis radical SAM protein BzaD [Anaerovirgula multivorans]SNR87420.1 putative variant cofactor biosynthesis B12-binding domain/radical SAM domain protein 1 [Anaerovirgula multivorans]